MGDKKLTVENRMVSGIIPYDFNSRNHDSAQIERIKLSIKDFGFNQPLVLDEHNVIIVGHGRYEAAKALGLEKVPCVIKTDLTDEQKRAYRILDNKLQNDSTWNWDNLKLDLDFLQDSGYDLSAYDVSSLVQWMENPREEDKSDLDEAKGAYETATIKQIVLYYDSETYERILKKLLKVQQTEANIQDNSEAVQFLADAYDHKNSGTGE